uniref:Uncharacterized protein n=1 Tax=Phakopsora pachyrhizi TaxID=170000 RepID=A0A0S1MJB7_PHAPC
MLRNVVAICVVSVAPVICEIVASVDLCLFMTTKNSP